MKYFIIFSLFLSAIYGRNIYSHEINNGCNEVKDFINNETLSGEWQLQPVLASDTASGKIPTLKFDLAAEKFSGFSGCNAINGSFVIKAEALSFNEQVISTKMACPGYNENIFMDNLLKTNRYQIK